MPKEKNTIILQILGVCGWLARLGLEPTPADGRVDIFTAPPCLCEWLHASLFITQAFLTSMQAITPLVSLGLLVTLKQQMPQYLAAAANAPTLDISDIESYTEKMLDWWRANGNSFPAWALGARVVFAFSPNSASCERVFSLLKVMFGEQQMSALADYIKAALMLRYNQRRVG